eukprot:gene10184-biopygen8645
MPMTNVPIDVPMAKTRKRGSEGGGITFGRIAIPGEGDLPSKVPPPPRLFRHGPRWQGFVKLEVELEWSCKSVWQGCLDKILSVQDGQPNSQPKPSFLRCVAVGCAAGRHASRATS